MKVPILDLTRQYEAIRADVDAGIRRVVQSGQFILGQEVEALEREIADFCGVKYAIGVASGTDALLLSLRALGIGPNDSVIVPSFTFFATAGVVHNVGATPIFCDIDSNTFNLDPAHLRKLLSSGVTPRPRAVIPVHLYGQMADMDEIMNLAGEFGLYVVEDAAQAIGAEYRGRKAGSLGHLGCFSFFPTKNLGAYGDGGMVVTSDEELGDRVQLLRVHGARPKYYHRIVGYNSRLDALQAAILRAKFPYLERWTEARRWVAAQYNELLRGIDNLQTPVQVGDRLHIFHQYTIRVRNRKRDLLRAFLKEREIGTEVYYPQPLHQQECFRGLGYPPGALLESERASQEVLSLPMFPELTARQVEYVAEAVADFFKGR